MIFPGFRARGDGHEGYRGRGRGRGNLAVLEVRALTDLCLCFFFRRMASCSPSPARIGVNNVLTAPFAPTATSSMPRDRRRAPDQWDKRVHKSRGVGLKFSVRFSSVPPPLRSRCRLVEMHCFTFIFVLIALFMVLSLAHPITHPGHHTIRARPNRRACKPPVVVSSGTSLIVEPSSSPSPDGEDDQPTRTPSTGGGSSLTDKLFPYGFGKKFWTTSEGIDGALPLSDATLKPTKVLKALSRDVVKAPDGKLGMKAHYPEGSYTFTHDPLGGFSFYAKGPSNVDLSTALEATFGYSVFFEKDFDYQLGGKLLGFCK